MNIALFVKRECSYILHVYFAGVLFAVHPNWNVIFTIVIRYNVTSSILSLELSLVGGFPLDSLAKSGFLHSNKDTRQKCVPAY